MAVRAFVLHTTSVENLGNDVYRVEVEIMLMDTSNSRGFVQFEAQWGADWRFIAKSAVVQWCLEHLGETVDGVVFPDFGST
jgi:hypothetical protein